MTIAGGDRRESFAEYQGPDDDEQFTEPPSPKRRRIDSDSDVLIDSSPRLDSTDSNVTRLDSDVTRLDSDVLIDSSPRPDCTDSDVTRLDSDVFIVSPTRPRQTDSDATESLPDP